VTTVLLPLGIELDPALPEGVRAVRYDVRLPVPAEHTDADVLVVWMNTPAQLADCARRLTRVRWVQTLAAGPDAVLDAGFGPDVVVTNGRGLHDGPVAEHTLALVLAAARRVPDLVRAQQEHRWARELGGAQQVDPTGAFRTLDGAHVLIWGFGSIAARLAPVLASLGAHVTGVARTAGERAGFAVVASADIDAELPTTDVLIGLLPATPETHHAIEPKPQISTWAPSSVRNAPVGSTCCAPPSSRAQRCSWVVNVGRGSTLDEDALLEALRAERLAGAALDVFATEPLPADSPLWDSARILISPHAAGGRPQRASELLAHNLAAFEVGHPLRNVVEH
jgi:phosphoglycerate dehydrogenase-like enzyme